MKLLLIAGSIRKASYNKHLLEELTHVLPEGVTVEWADIAALPHYNDDIDNDDDRPESVSTFRAQARNADAVVISTPEYNYAYPGVLKNALDWGSRPYGQSVWAAKPLAVIGASPSFMGTARAQQQLKTLATSLSSKLYVGPEVLVSLAHERFDAHGKLSDEGTKAVLASFATNFLAFVANA